jgi:hypothetical protein
VVGFTTGSRGEVPGKKENLWQEMIIIIMIIILINVIIIIIMHCCYRNCETSSWVSIVSGYWLDDRAIEVRSPAEARGYFLKPLCPDQLWGNPASCTVGPVPGGKAGPGRDADHSPFLVLRSRMSKNLFSPQAPQRRVVEQLQL